MDFDEDDTPVEESYLFNEEGNQLMADENELDVDAEGEEEGEGASDEASDDPSSASDEDGSEEENDDQDDDDDLMDVDVSVVDPEATRRSSRLNGRMDYKDPSQPQPNHSPSLPPSLQRQRLFYPPPNAPIPRTINLNPLISVPIASPVHALAASLCLSHVLTGSQDGYVRDWDTFASANGGRDGRPVLGAEGIRGGVCRGWWASDGRGGMPGPEEPRKEPVYSLACQRDGLWGLSGIGNGSINLFTIRHAVGTTHHVLSGGHKSAVSSLVLGESEDLLYSGGWDGALVEWDLNTGKQIRTFPTQPSQISSISLQPPPSGTSSSSTSSSNYNIFIRDLLLPTTNNGTRISSVDPPDATSDLTSIPSLTNGHHPLTNGDAEPEPTPVPSRRPSEMDAEGEDDDLTSADAEGEKEEDDLVVDSTQPSPTTNSPPAPHPEFPLPAPTTNGHLPADSSTIAVADSTNPPPLPSTTTADASPRRPFYPSLSPASYESYSQDVLLTSSIDGGLLLWDRRVPQASGSKGVGSLSSNASPWCMSACFSSNGTQVYAGRRNGTVEVWDVRRTSSSSSPNLFKTLRNPSESGPVSSVVAFPDGKHIACASADAIRLWSTSFEEVDDPTPRRHGGIPPWKVVAGHSGGRVSSMILDPLSRFLITASGNRGWGPPSTESSSSVVQFHTVESIF